MKILNLYAYLNPEKNVLVTVNEYGEAKIEMFLIIPLITILGFVTLYLAHKEYDKLR